MAVIVKNIILWRAILNAIVESMASTRNLSHSAKQVNTVADSTALENPDTKRMGMLPMIPHVRASIRETWIPLKCGGVMMNVAKIYMISIFANMDSGLV
jgi:hypothetical protein